MPTGVYDHISRRGIGINDEVKNKIRLKLLGRKMPDYQKQKISAKLLGRKKSNAERVAIRNRMIGNKNHLGIPQSEETRIKMSKSARRGSLSNLWKGGVANKNKLIRSSVEYKLWRDAVFKRDDYTCVWCTQKGGKLNADHIKPFSLFPELRFAIDNGRTLCEDCHKTTDSYLNNSLSTWTT